LNKKGQLTTTASPAQLRRSEILRLATAYELYGGLRRRLGGLMKCGVLWDKNSTKSPAWWAGELSCWKVKKSSATERIGIFHIGNLCFWVPFLKQLLLRNCAVDFAEICNVYSGKMIIKAVKRRFNSDKICRSYSDLNFGITFFGTQCISGVEF